MVLVGDKVQITIAIVLLLLSLWPIRKEIQKEWQTLDCKRKPKKVPEIFLESDDEPGLFKHLKGKDDKVSEISDTKSEFKSMIEERDPSMVIPKST